MSSLFTFRVIFPMHPNLMIFRGIGGNVLQYELSSTHTKTNFAVLQTTYCSFTRFTHLLFFLN